jgi:hypothetical protein
MLGRRRVRRPPVIKKKDEMAMNFFSCIIKQMDS